MNTRGEIIRHLIGYVDERLQTNDTMETLGYIDEVHFIETLKMYKANPTILASIAEEFDRRYGTNMKAAVITATRSLDFEEIVKSRVDEKIDELFRWSHEYMQTTSGDITPDQQMELDELQAKLSALIIKQTRQNL